MTQLGSNANLDGTANLFRSVHKNGSRSLLLQEKNRLENVELVIRESIDCSITYLNNEIKKIEKKINKHIYTHSELESDSKLLISIPGIGDKTAFLSQIKNFDKAKSVAALALVCNTRNQVLH